MPNWAGTGRKRGKKNHSGTVSLDPSWSVPKIIVKKFLKCHSSFISSQTRSGQAKKEIKKFLFQVPFLADLGSSIPKKIEKYSKKLI